MKKQLSVLSVAILSAALLFSSCKKESASVVDNSTEFKNQSDDQARFSNETDAVTDDANAALESSGGSYAGARPLSPALPLACDASVTVDTLSNPRTITIVYNGDSTCNWDHRTRTGTVVLSFAPGFRWSNVGAQYSITYQNLKITRKRDNKSITINGTKTVKNVTGGRLRNLATIGQIVHEISSTGMTVTFDNNTQRTWQMARRRTYTYDNGMVISITGFGNNGNDAEWGTNRAGNSFTSAITSPLVIKQSCNFRLLSGQVTHTNVHGTTVTTFGLDITGNPVTACPGILPLYYKLQWTGNNGATLTYIAPY